MESIRFKTPAIVGCYIADVWSRFNSLPETGGVYLLTESNLNLQYVGSSINVRLRAIQHMHPASPTYYKALFLEANPKHITIELLEDCAGMAIPELRESESVWINKLKTTYPYGLNVNSPKKGSSARSLKDYKIILEAAEAKPPCYHLLKFSQRMDYYIEIIRTTPVNQLWFAPKNGLNQVVNSRKKFSHLKTADVTRQFDYSSNYLSGLIPRRKASLPIKTSSVLA